ncbi:hypothetical protein MMC07_005075 [Pseudocyphellaria aurata]|nr:hypothetical protein [Pseudocyphellaria aurata]
MDSNAMTIIKNLRAMALESPSVSFDSHSDCDHESSQAGANLTGDPFQVSSNSADKEGPDPTENPFQVGSDPDSSCDPKEKNPFEAGSLSASADDISQARPNPPGSDSDSDEEHSAHPIVNSGSPKSESLPSTLMEEEHLSSFPTLPSENPSTNPKTLADTALAIPSGGKNKRPILKLRIPIYVGPTPRRVS